MGTTQPIRDYEDLEKFKNYYLDIQPQMRNYTLIILGLNTALRISDILHLKWKDVYDFETNEIHKHICIKEHKTGKDTMIALNETLKKTLLSYLETLPSVSGETYLFTSHRCPKQPLSRSQAYRIVRKAAENSVHQKHISCHSMRKTFGYQAWKQGIPSAVLVEIYNHSSYQITKRYLGIEQDDKDHVFMEIKL